MAAFIRTRWHWVRYRCQWWLSPPAAAARGVQLVTRVGRRPADMRGIQAEVGGTAVGRLDFQICHRCRSAWIRRVYVDEQYQRRGIAESMLQSAVFEGPGYRWDTAGQFRSARGFWDAMKARSGLALQQLTHAAVCVHMRNARTDDPVRPRSAGATW